MMTVDLLDPDFVAKAYAEIAQHDRDLAIIIKRHASKGYDPYEVMEMGFIVYKLLEYSAMYGGDEDEKDETEGLEEYFDIEV
jgi:hypothetical protein